MAKHKRVMIPEAEQAMANMKFEIAKEMGVPLTQGYNGNVPARLSGSIGGEMVKRMIQSYESSHQ